MPVLLDNSDWLIWASFMACFNLSENVVFIVFFPPFDAWLFLTVPMMGLCFLIPKSDSSIIGLGMLE